MPTLTVVTPESLKKAERAYCRAARKAYRAAWGHLRTRLPELQELKKAAIDPNLLSDLQEELVSGMEAGAEAAAGVLDAEGAADLIARYQQMFQPIGGFKGIADTATAGILSTIDEWYRDPETDMGDLSAALSKWFAPWRAEMVGITETTRMGTAATMLAGERLGAEKKVWNTSADDVVCSECLGLDGQEFDIGDPDGDPPAHPGCRCGSALRLPGDEEMDEGGDE